jgi:hypothetical protein
MEEQKKTIETNNQPGSITVPDAKYDLIHAIKRTSMISFGNTIHIDSQVYMIAYNQGAASPSNTIRTINPRIDGINYPDIVSSCVKMIYRAGCPNHTPILTSSFYLEQIGDLPKYLAMIEWCSTLKPSKTYEQFLLKIKELILLAFDVVHAICDDDFNVLDVGRRLAILSGKCPYDIGEPECLRNVAFECVCHMLGYGECCRRTAENNEIISYTWGIYRKIFMIKYPNFLQIPNFGPECAAAVSKLFKPEEILFSASGIKQRYICDVFMRGLGKIFTKI